MEHEGPVATYNADGFLRLIEQKLGADRAVAERVARAVLAALWTAVGPKEFADMGSQLPGDFLVLLEAGRAEAPLWANKPPPPFRGPLTVDELLGLIAQRAALDPGRARTAAEAVLEVLAMRVAEGQIEDLKPFIPPELHDPLNVGVMRSHGRARSLSVEQFLDEIARREGEGVTRELAAVHARAVLSVLREAVGEKEFRDTVSQLSRDYLPLVEAAWTGTATAATAGTSPGGTVPASGTRQQPPEFIGLSADEFIGRVGERADLDPTRAAKVTEGVLEALAMRVTDGQVEDLKPFIGSDLHDPLNRGIQRSKGRARRMPIEQFLDEVARQEGEGVTEEKAAAHARAVFSVLREAVGEKEFRDTVAQLPAEYELLLPHARRPR